MSSLKNLQNKLRQASFLIGFLLICFSVLTPTVAALSQSDQNAIYNDSVWYKIGGNPCAPDSTTTSQGGEVYFVGDSIGGQVQGPLNTSFSSKGSSFTHNVADGRTLPEGTTAINNDQAKIKAASAVVIELGTNAGGFTASNVNQMVSTIRSFAPGTNIYWVDTAVVELADYAQTLSDVNKVIYDQAGHNNYTVISWNKKVFGDSANPRNINPDAPDNGYIRHRDQFVHLTPTGITAMTELIVASVSTSSNPSADASCACSGGGTPLSGNSDKEKIWNYFRFTKGLSAESTAGIMGNIESESAGTWDPTIVEGGSHSDIVPRPVAALPGYGLVQWSTVNRKNGLIKLVADHNLPQTSESNLGMQLDYIWQELENSYQDVLRIVRQPNTGDIATPTYKWLEEYEVPADIEGNKPVRLNHATDIFNEFSGRGGSGGPAEPCVPPSGEIPPSGDVLALCGQVDQLRRQGKITFNHANDQAAMTTGYVVRETAEGKGEHVPVDPQLCRLMIYLTGKVSSFRVWTLVGTHDRFVACGSPPCNESRHWTGHAIDIDQIENQLVESPAGKPATIKLMKAVDALIGTNLVPNQMICTGNGRDDPDVYNLEIDDFKLAPNFYSADDHRNHVHIGY